MNSTRRRSFESPKERSEWSRSGGMVAAVSSRGSRWFRNAKYSWRIRESPMNTKWLCFPQNARYRRHLLVSLKHQRVLFFGWFHAEVPHNVKNTIFLLKFLRLTVMVHHTAIRLPLLVSFVPPIWQKPFAWIYSYGTHNILFTELSPWRDWSEVRNTMNVWIQNACLPYFKCSIPWYRTKPITSARARSFAFLAFICWIISAADFPCLLDASADIFDSRNYNQCRKH